jgi:hypothetical protein
MSKIGLVAVFIVGMALGHILWSPMAGSAGSVPTNLPPDLLICTGSDPDHIWYQYSDKYNYRLKGVNVAAAGRAGESQHIGQGWNVLKGD